MKKKKPANIRKLQRKALELAKPLYARPAALARVKQNIALRNEHIALQEATYRRNENYRLTGQLASTMNPALRNEMFAQKAKLFK